MSLDPFTVFHNSFIADLKASNVGNYVPDKNILEYTSEISKNLNLPVSDYPYLVMMPTERTMTFTSTHARIRQSFDLQVTYDSGKLYDGLFPLTWELMRVLFSLAGNYTAGDSSVTYTYLVSFDNATDQLGVIKGTIGFKSVYTLVAELYVENDTIRT